MTLFEDIRILCELPGVSGREEPIREYIISQLPEGVSYETDALGNLYVEKKGAKRPKNKVVLFAHMDEVGLMITYITDDGYLKFDEIGGIDPAVIIGRTVRLECGLVGVISLKALHLCEGDEDKKILPIRELCIDIGAKDRAEAEKLKIHWKATAIATAAPRMVFGKISEISTQQIGPQENMNDAE